MVWLPKADVVVIECGRRYSFRTAHNGLAGSRKLAATSLNVIVDRGGQILAGDIGLETHELPHAGLDIDTSEGVLITTSGNDNTTTSPLRASLRMRLKTACKCLLGQLRVTS